MSIKEKGEEIKGQEDALTETFILLEEPQKLPTHSVFSSTISSLIVAVMMVASLGSYALGNYAGRNSVVTDHITPTTNEVHISRTVHGTSGNEIKAASSTRVEGVGSSQSAAAAIAKEGSYVGSRKGTKYHLPWCPGARAISGENKVWFESKVDAELKGYTAAANCKGM